MSATQPGRGTLFVISAPSGTGKSTVARRLVEATRGLEFSVSYTTRGPRPGEQEGKDYHFIGDAGFGAMVDEKAFLEWADVFGYRYGTGLEATRRILSEGRDLLLDIDIQGARQVRRGPVPAISIMLLPPDYATLEARLRGRGSEAEGQREDRLARARQEAGEYAEFDFLIINDQLDGALAELEAIVRAERCRTDRRRAEAERVLATFPSGV
jgi:guanylate kinase